MAAQREKNMDLKAPFANICENYSLYGNAGLQILQADETFKVKVELNPETENHAAYGRTRLICLPAVSFSAARCRCVISPSPRNSVRWCAI